LNQLQLVSDLKIPAELQRNLIKSKLLKDEINATNESLNAQVFKIIDDEEEDDGEIKDFSKFYDEKNQNKVNTIISESEIHENRDVSFNPSYMA
jgi:hypothetical protein